LFSIIQTHCFGAKKSPVYDDSFEYRDVFSLRNIIDKKNAWLASVGYQLMNWYVQNNYCGRCGSETVLKNDERAIVCSACNHIIFPKISPAIIVAITCNNKILLIKGKNYRSKFFTLVAGYVDVGESIEETVAREVKEEVGLEIKNVRYFKSQPWPYSFSLMMGFTAEADENQQIIIDENEVEEAAWFTRDNLPVYNKGISISGDLIEAFEKGKL
jgi:NAD+ diphosphatase